MKLQTRIYEASTGRSGGAAIPLITKSGTTEFHGWATSSQNEKSKPKIFQRTASTGPKERAEGG